MSNDKNNPKKSKLFIGIMIILILLVIMFNSKASLTDYNFINFLRLNESLNNFTNIEHDWNASQTFNDDVIINGNLTINNGNLVNYTSWNITNTSYALRYCYQNGTCIDSQVSNLSDIINDVNNSIITNHNELNNLNWASSGHYMDTDLDMNGNDVTASNFYGGNGYFDNIYNKTEVDSLMKSTTYYASNITTIYGTNDGGNLTSIWYYNGGTYNVSEANGLNPLDVRINYTNITEFNEIIIREYYEGSVSHIVKIEIYEPLTDEWEEYFEFVGQSGFNVLDIPVYDSLTHIDENGTVQVRIIHEGNGISSHNLYIDFAWLIKGDTVGGSTNLVGYAKYDFGNNDFNGSGDFVTTGEVDANTGDFANEVAVGTTSGKLIMGDITGNSRGSRALDIQSNRNSVSQVASGNDAVAVGTGNTVSSSTSVAVGIGNNVGGFSSNLAFGVQNVITGAASSAFGFNNEVSGPFSLALGTGLIVTDSNVVEIGGSNDGKITISSSGDISLNGGTGDINASTIYYDTLQAKSPIVMCSDMDCKVTVPELQKDYYLTRDEDYNILSSSETLPQQVINKFSSLKDNKIKSDCESDGYSYWTGNKCLENPYLKCERASSTVFNWTTNQCEYNAEKDCRSNGGIYENKTCNTPEITPETLEELRLSCIENKGMMWKENECIDLKLYLAEPYTQPTGAHDAYVIGDIVIWNDKYYESTINANVWSPATYPAGWSEIQ